MIVHAPLQRGRVRELRSKYVYAFSDVLIPDNFISFILFIQEQGVRVDYELSSASTSIMADLAASHDDVDVNERQNNNADSVVIDGDQNTAEHASKAGPKTNKRPLAEDENQDADHAAAKVEEPQVRRKSKRTRKMKPLPKGRPIRVYDGIFDMFHFGHARMLEQAKNVFPGHEVHLVVGVCSDDLTHAMKGKTVMNEYERYESVRHCKHVDEVVEDAPWVLSDAFLNKHKIDYVAHDDDPYPDASGTAVDVYDFVKAKGMFVATKRTEGISTSDVITRIVKGYDQFVRRNLERGYSRKDMNVSYLKETRIKMAGSVERLQGQVEAQMGEMRNNVRDNVTEISDNINRWMDNSHRVIEDFMSLFGRNAGSLKEMVRTQSERLTQLAKNSPM